MSVTFNKDLDGGDHIVYLDGQKIGCIIFNYDNYTFLNIELFNNTRKYVIDDLKQIVTYMKQIGSVGNNRKLTFVIKNHQLLIYEIYRKFGISRWIGVLFQNITMFYHSAYSPALHVNELEQIIDFMQSNCIGNCWKKIGF